MLAIVDEAMPRPANFGNKRPARTWAAPGRHPNPRQHLTGARGRPPPSLLRRLLSGPAPPIRPQTPSTCAGHLRLPVRAYLAHRGLVLAVLDGLDRTSSLLHASSPRHLVALSTRVVARSLAYGRGRARRYASDLA
jgi:hypothetical protein